jgi:serine/threonine protein kinase
MIKEKEKYFAMSGYLPIGGPSTWHITDWDQRRVVSVTMDGEQEDETIDIRHFRRHAAQLPPDVYRVYLSDTGDIIKTYSDPEDDQNHCVHYPTYEEVAVPLHTQTVSRGDLEELDRFGPHVDLVAHRKSTDKVGVGTMTTGPQELIRVKVVFKYYFHWQFAHRSWKEMQIYMRLPPHPNIVPFDSVVVDELTRQLVVGFTTKYIPGGDLEQNRSRVFKLKWLQQLLKVIDDLNLRYGIVHQDVAARNILLDESTDSIRLFDFNFAARTTKKGT